MRPRRMGRLTVAAALGQAARGARRQWQALPPERRNRLQVLLRQSGGRPSNLSAAERRELQAIVAELRLGEVVRQSAMRASRRGFFRR
jgi:uncharacterized protein YbgA (DUF1722 family)